MTRSFLNTIGVLLLASVVGNALAAGQNSGNDSFGSPPRSADHSEQTRSPEATNPQAAVASIQTALREASAEFDVPLAVLHAVAYTNSGWVQRNPTSEGDIPPSYGVMGLRDDDLFGHSLREAAVLIARDPEVLRTDARENIRGGAAVMAKLARMRRRGIGENITSSVSTWDGVLADFSGIPRAETANLFAETVLNAVHTGFEVRGLEIPGDGDANFSTKSVRVAPLATTSCPNVTWQGDGIPSSNYQVGRSGVPITTVVIHTTEGSAAATLATFQDPTRIASSTYLVNRDGSIWQFVSEANTAYHCGNLSYNHASIGIELEGWADGSPTDDFSWQTSAQWNSLESLLNCLRNAYGIPLDRAHMFGHNQVPDAAQPQYWGGASHHYDPGAYWNWDRLMSDLGRTSTPSVVTLTSQCTVITLPQTGAPTITQAWSGERFSAYDTSGNYKLIFLAGQEAALLSPALGPGWFHWDGWVPASCVSTVSSATQMKVAGTAPSTLRVRAGAQSNSTILGHLGDGKIVAATGNTQTGFDGYLWYEFYLGDINSTKTGWSSSAYLIVSGSQPTCYTLTRTHSGQGGDPTAAPSNSTGCTSGQYLAGAPISLSASPASGWSVGSWSGTSNNASTSTTNSLTMPPSAQTVSVTYSSTPPCYTLTRTHSGQGDDPTATPSNSTGCTSGQYLAGAPISLSASPASGWSVSSWSGTSNNASTSTTNSLTMPASGQTVSVTYSSIPPTCYTLIRTHSGQGGDPAATPSSSTGCTSGQYIAGEPISLTASPASGWSVSSWSGTSNNASTSTTNSVTMAESNQTVSVTYSGSGSGTDLIIDGGFESATASGTVAPGWTVTPSPGSSHWLIIKNGPYSHAGTTYGSLGGVDFTQYDWLLQTVAIPSNATAANLTGWINVTTQEPAGNTAYDVLWIAIYDQSGNPIATLRQLSNLDAPLSNNTLGNYFQVGPFDLTAYKGTSVQVAFVALTDSSYPTTFLVDDVSLQVTTADSPPTTSVTSPSNGATVSGTISVNATASDDVAVTSLEIDIDGASKTSNSNSSSLSYSWNTTQFSNGQHTIVSKAGDGAGHFTTSSQVTVSVSNNIACSSFTISPSSATPSSAAGSQPVTVSGSPQGCQGGNWGTTGNGSWLTVSPANGSGPGTVTVSWGQNPSSSQRSGTAVIANNNFFVTQGGIGQVLPHIVRTDIDADHKSDISIFRPLLGDWFFRRSTTGQTAYIPNWGPQASDIPVPGDYDGDQVVDAAVFRPLEGNWYIRRSSTGTLLLIAQWGLGANDKPVAGDYDGDGKTDAAIFRPLTGEWFIHRSSDGGTTYVPNYGPGANDIPVPGDYDGDGKTDIAIFRPITGEWFIRQSSNGATMYVPNFGPLQNDKPVPADYDGDGKTDIAIFRPIAGDWFIRRSSDGGVTYVPNYGPLSNDRPVPADYDGDGKADIAIYRPGPGDWFIRQSTNGVTLYVPNYGPQSNDKPLPAYQN
jgi:N-acetyl-anhydromuramyl-L-alanine amidase AmpD